MLRIANAIARVQRHRDEPLGPRSGRWRCRRSRSGPAARSGPPPGRGAGRAGCRGGSPRRAVASASPTSTNAAAVFGAIRLGWPSRSASRSSSSRNRQLVGPPVPAGEVAPHARQADQQHADRAGDPDGAAAGRHHLRRLHPQRHAGQQEGQGRPPGVHGRPPGDQALEDGHVERPPRQHQDTDQDRGGAGRACDGRGAGEIARTYGHAHSRIRSESAATIPSPVGLRDDLGASVPRGGPGGLCLLSYPTFASTSDPRRARNRVVGRSDRVHILWRVSVGRLVINKLPEVSRARRSPRPDRLTGRTRPEYRVAASVRRHRS